MLDADRRSSSVRISMPVVIALTLVPPLALAALAVFADSLVDLAAEALWFVIATGLIVRLVVRRDASAEERLRASEQRLRTALDVIDDGYWDLDVATGRLDVSARFLTILGRQPGEILPRIDAW